ncbi:hypothetical protein B0H14DRAFT_2762917 [Mycena olivaceomarginata]|nr:hypothetical protein B0H14DRAFT_2762917 [Mycena olivaceomarginata]
MASTIFGSLVAAICVNLLLYTLELVMACQLLARKSDGTRITAKFRVCLNLLIDTAATVAGCAFLYLFQGSHWGENDDVQSNYWRIIVGVLCIGTVSGAVAQSVLLERFWKNIRHHLLGTAFAVTILIMAVLTSVAATVACAYLQWTNASSILVPFVWVALICNLIAALGITTVSVCQRFAMRTVTPKKHLIARAWRAFIETGLPSSIIAILALVAWAIDKKGEFVIALYFIQARVYSSTMMFALRNPLPPRADWIQDMISNSVPQMGPVHPPSPDIFLKNEKTIRMSLPVIPEGKGSTWFNIDLGNETATSAPETEDIASNAKNAVVLHRNAAFYQVSGEGKQ